ncbi:MBL fold metallo-hydrolase [Archaeoglobus neptunius]|uniref:MBL fold metallo-hydrolase n=1 Tax=Archaeoglobus neptunius TaxID=2798580 RepID=UPI00192520EF|nr:MBL fold metallo-hydrolase [Archaeoglobus neptunius]
MEIIRNVYFIEGENRGRYPFSNSLLIGKSCLIDSGSGKRINNLNVECIMNSHWHEDHIAMNKIGKKVMAHHLDVEAIENYGVFRDRYGIGDAVRMFISFEFGRVDVAFEDGDRFEFQGVEIEVLHTPGHAAGHCCFLIDDAVIFLGDIDLTSFGPWYGCRDCNVGDFVRSIETVEKIVEKLEIKIAIPSHGAIVSGTENILKKLKEYKGKIYERDRKIGELISKGTDPVGKGIFYRKIPEPKMVFLSFEKMMVEKHITTFRGGSYPY